MNNPRETAWRLFATELNTATYTIEPEGEKKPSYQLTKLGARVNRVLVAGVLTEKENVGSDDEPMWKGRILDPISGTVFINVGRYQPEAAAAMTDIEVPSNVAVVGKVKSYTNQEGKTFVTIRPERIVSIDETTKNEWLLDTAKTTWKRLVDMRRATELEDSSLEGLAKAGFSDNIAKGISLALDVYGMPESAVYLKSIQTALRTLLPDANVDLGIPDDNTSAPEEFEMEPQVSAAEAGDRDELVLGLLEELDRDGKGALREELEEVVGGKGITPMDLEEIINGLLDQGLVYEPNLRYLKRI